LKDRGIEGLKDRGIEGLKDGGVGDDKRVIYK
jgi:hypothetical protein